MMARDVMHIVDSRWLVVKVVSKAGIELIARCEGLAQGMGQSLVSK